MQNDFTNIYLILLLYIILLIIIITIKGKIIKIKYFFRKNVTFSVNLEVAALTASLCIDYNHPKV